MKKSTLSLLLLISTIQLNAQQKWKLAKDEDGIKVYVGEVLGSDYYAFKAITLINTTELAFVNTIKEVNKYPEWYAFTASTRLISQSKNEQTLFMETDYPWPYANECKNYRVVFEKLQDNKLKRTITGLNTEIKCKYTLKKASGYMLVEPENEKLKITYYFHSEPSQGIPSWLINPRIHEMPLKTLKALKKKIEQLR